MTQAAEEQLLSRCMHEKGFRYRPVRLPEEAGRPDRNPYGLLTPQEAATDGLGVVSARLNQGPPRDPNTKESSRPGWDRALLGTSSHRVTVRLPHDQAYFYNSDSCTTRMTSQLYGQRYEKLYNTYQVWTMQVVSTVEKRSSFKAAQRRWAACMRDEGAGVTSLSEPANKVEKALRQARGKRHGLRSVMKTELRLARLNASCQRRVKLAATVATLQQEAERDVLGRLTGTQSDLRELRERALERARRLVNSPGNQLSGTPAGAR
ncbi:hypothetical protein [Streptomyces sp. NPDC048436]|uniref:hypothetical protein n=1 Tax=Streptomyces sp. NPDC048436 TaxID=3365550 RepID=UPI0037122027